MLLSLSSIISQRAFRDGKKLFIMNKSFPKMYSSLFSEAKENDKCPFHNFFVKPMVKIFVFGGI